VTSDSLQPQCELMRHTGSPVRGVPYACILPQLLRFSSLKQLQLLLVSRPRDKRAVRYDAADDLSSMVTPMRATKAVSILDSPLYALRVVMHYHSSRKLT
jgi:hypothetical protein